MNRSGRSTRNVAMGDYLGAVGIVAAALGLARNLFLGGALLAITAAGALAVTPYRRRVNRAKAWIAVLAVAATLLVVAAFGGFASVFHDASTVYPETAGGNLPTWTDYTNGGGTQGPNIPAYTAIKITCRLTGLRVHDGNPWWYRIAQHPWSSRFYASADGFYNNGATSGSLKSTPRIDRKVPVCRRP